MPILRENYVSEKLSGCENYSAWKFYTRLYLVHENSREGITGFKDDDTCTKAEREELSEKARAKICLAVKPNAISHVRVGSNAAEAWTYLGKAYGLTRRPGPLKRLFNLEFALFPPMDSYAETTVARYPLPNSFKIPKLD